MYVFLYIYFFLSPLVLFWLYMYTSFHHCDRLDFHLCSEKFSVLSESEDHLPVFWFLLLLLLFCVFFFPPDSHEFPPLNYSDL